MKAILGAVIAATIVFPAPSAEAGEGHDAGYNWAEKKGIDDPDSCYSRSGEAINNSPSFTEGCLQFLQDSEITNQDDEPINEDDEDDQ